MKTKKIWANFSVKDAQRTREFYTHLGFTPNNPNNDPKLASFVFGDDGFTLSAETEVEVNQWAQMG